MTTADKDGISVSVCGRNGKDPVGQMGTILWSVEFIYELTMEDDDEN